MCHYLNRNPHMWGLVSVPAPNEVSVERLERSTNGLKGHCSAIELHARFNEKYSITRVPLAQALTFFTQRLKSSQITILRSFTCLRSPS
jgi:hypothetical protein